MKVVSYAKLPLHLDAEATRRQLQATGGEWKAHLNTYHYTGTWNVLPLRSPNGNHANPVPDLMGESEFKDTIYMDDFPAVKAMLSAMHCPVMAVRFLNLRAGAIIKEHRDHQLALEKGEARLHFPVITNPQVEFYSENERIYLNEGECWYLNANLPHRVSNNGPSDRIHLVVDCSVNDWLKTLITSSQPIAYSEVKTDGNILIAISELRKQGTEDSNKRADMLQQIVNQSAAK